MISYDCSIVSNSETLHLTWRVTLPGDMPSNTTYENSSEPNSVRLLHPFGFITTVLTEYKIDEYIASTLILEVQPTFPANLTILECFIETLANDSIDIVLNSSGMTALHIFCKAN